MLTLGPNFGSPVIAVFGVLCAWIIVFFPFALWCRAITRADGLSRVEAFILGQSCGPAGVWLVMRANKAAAAKAYRNELLVDHMKHPDAAHPGATPEEIQRQNREHGRPQISELPGGRAFRAKHDVRPATAQAQLEKVGLTDPVRPGPPPKQERPPIEPPPPPPTKAARAWQPPPADYKFTHSDETPDQPQAGGGPVDG